VDVDAFAAVAALAGRQYGLVTWDQALAAGLSPAVIRRLIAQGHLVRVARGLYRLAGFKATWRSRLMAACLQAGRDAVVSHRSAAAVWRLEGFEPPLTIDLSIPHSRRPRIERARVHRRDVPRRSFRDGIPVTPIPETILDLCAISANQGIPLRALDDVRRRSLVSTAELTRCAADHSERRTAGIPLYRSLLERRLGRTPPGTVFAAEVLELLVAAGLPEPECEVWVAIGGRRYRIDLAYPRPKIAIECLGKIGHLNERAFEEDPVRNNNFALDGWLQLQVTYWRVQENPEAVVSSVKAALACRGGV
jgi:hypothetical protein